ncbi:hypothetical protein [Bacillus massiliglaciei]|nr:hypothetical protein [Bacillus massiliglaciei]
MKKEDKRVKEHHAVQHDQHDESQTVHLEHTPEPRGSYGLQVDRDAEF